MPKGVVNAVPPPGSAVSAAILCPQHSEGVSHPSIEKCHVSGRATLGHFGPPKIPKCFEKGGLGPKLGQR